LLSLLQTATAAKTNSIMVNVLTAALVAQVLTERKKPDKTYFFQYYRSQTHEGIEYSSIAYSVLLCPGRLRTVTQMCSTEQYSEYGTELTPKYSEYSEYEYSIRVLSVGSKQSADTVTGGSEDDGFVLVTRKKSMKDKRVSLHDGVAAVPHESICNVATPRMITTDTSIRNESVSRVHSLETIQLMK
jgi:hypothetical protein